MNPGTGILLRVTLNIHPDTHLGRLLVISDRGGHKQIFHVHIAHSQQRHVSVDSSQPPRIEGIELVALAAGADLHSNDVLPIAMYQLCNIEITSIEGAVEAPCFLAVDPKFEAIGNTLKTNDHMAIIPAGRDRELSPIETTLFFRFEIGELAKALDLPVARHGNGISLAVIKTAFLEIFSLLRQVEFPLAVE